MICFRHLLNNFMPEHLLFLSEVMVEYEVTESELIEKWLSEKRGGKVSICSEKGNRKKDLSELAHKNAAMVLTKDMEKIKREEERTTGAMKQISGWLGLEDVSRVESYDISKYNVVFYGRLNGCIRRWQNLKKVNTENSG